jgi:glycosyltransferase involved in cell wall biosynthesis
VVPETTGAMNILHVTPYYEPAWSFGGVCRAVTDLARAQVEAGHRVSVLTTDALTRSTRLPSGECAIDGVHVIRLRNASLAARRLNLSTPLGFRKAARRLLDAGDVDVVHCHELRTTENLQLAALDARSRAPLVLSPHGTLSYGTGRSLAKRGWDALTAGRLLPQFELVVALTGKEAAEALALWKTWGKGLDDDRVVIVPNGVDARAFARLPERAAARSRFGIGADAPLVLFLGRLVERKGVSLLLAAFNEVVRTLPAAHLLVVGPDEGEGRPLTETVERLGLAQHVHLTGLLAGTDRLAAFAAADVFALPAVGEGLPIAVLEAMAAGVPSVLSDDCDVPGLLDGGGGVAVPRDVGNWASALAALLANRERRAKMGRAARALAETRYAWPLLVCQIDAAYQTARRRRREA